MSGEFLVILCATVDFLICAEVITALPVRAAQSVFGFTFQQPSALRLENMTLAGQRPCSPRCREFGITTFVDAVNSHTSPLHEDPPPQTVAQTYVDTPAVCPC